MRTRRRSFLAFVAAAPFIVGQQTLASRDTDGAVRNNISAFRLHEWLEHFDALGLGLIICDTSNYPTSVPLTDELTRRGYTEVVEKRENPSWAPTPSCGKAIVNGPLLFWVVIR